MSRKYPGNGLCDDCDQPLQPPRRFFCAECDPEMPEDPTNEDYAKFWNTVVALDAASAKRE